MGLCVVEDGEGAELLVDSEHVDEPADLQYLLYLLSELSKDRVPEKQLDGLLHLCLVLNDDLNLGVIKLPEQPVLVSLALNLDIFHRAADGLQHHEQVALAGAHIVQQLRLEVAIIFLCIHRLVDFLELG